MTKETMISIDYQKRKNTELFKTAEDPCLLFLSQCQNYIPIYTKFFSLNETNYNSINLNHKYYITQINKQLDNNVSICKIKNSLNHKVAEKRVFFKLAPLLDPYKYMVGKYDVSNPKLFQLPAFNEQTHPKMMDVNNCAYVDGFFLYLSSMLIHQHQFINGVDFYGSFLSIKNNFQINVFDDYDYLLESDFFNTQNTILFHCINDNANETMAGSLKRIHIGNPISLSSTKSINELLFEDVFETENKKEEAMNELEPFQCEIGDDDVNNQELSLSKKMSSKLSLKSSSSCSSRTSHTNDNDLNESDDNESYDEDDNEDNDDNEDIDEDNDDNEDIDNEDDDVEDEEVLYATIPKFPVQVIGMECCENTFDHLIMSGELDECEGLNENKWLSALMQIVMILITYQKAFHFTHNDLHTNNIMYNTTTQKYLYYCYKEKYYKVPTFGRIFKIIDFGRSIYKFQNKLFCSDSFQHDGDASTQYNTEPYLNDKKPRLEPNFSFDLCRLACSIFDYVIDDLKNINVKSGVKHIIYEWCLDDNNNNMLYKTNGTERYPEFKLYKMIARCVHNHVPHLQLERPEFSQYICSTPKSNQEVINIDSIPCYYNNTTMPNV